MTAPTVHPQAATTRHDFTGRVALVTGASGGIGRALCMALSRAGATVWGMDIQPVPDELRAEGVELYRGDVASSADVGSAVEAALARHGRLDFAVACAGVTRDHVLWKCSDDDWRSVLEVNLTGAFLLFRAACRPMREARQGRLVAIASINGLRGKAGQANYAASKAGLVGLVKSAARELGRRQITVNAVAPGWVETPMTAAVPAEFRRAAVDESLTGRLCDPSDVVACTLFLLSDEARQVTGQVLAVDGGQAL